MNEESQTPNPSTEEASQAESTPQTESSTQLEVTTESGTTDTTTSVDFTNPENTQIMVTSPVDPREQTIFETSQGKINVIHEVTLGEVILSTILMAILIFMVLDRVIRR